MVKLLIQKRCLRDKSICIQMNTISCLFRMQMPERSMLNERGGVFMCARGAELGSSSWAPGERRTRRPTEHIRKQKERRLCYQARAGGEPSSSPKRGRSWGRTFYQWPFSLPLTPEHNRRERLPPSLLEYHYRPRLWGGMVQEKSMVPTQG